VSSGRDAGSGGFTPPRSRLATTFAVTKAAAMTAPSPTSVAVEVVRTHRVSLLI
jgi:hypothetical protein